jgi:hypothetical protein
MARDKIQNAKAISNLSRAVPSFRNTALHAYVPFAIMVLDCMTAKVLRSMEPYLGFFCICGITR